MSWCRRRTGDETFEEGLFGEILVVLLEVLLGGRHELYGGELVAVDQIRLRCHRLQCMLGA